MNACPGVRLEATSAPSALALTDSMKVLTTGSATSASSSATRTSRSASAMLSSVMRPRPRRVSSVAGQAGGQVVEHGDPGSADSTRDYAVRRL